MNRYEDVFVWEFEGSWWRLDSPEEPDTADVYIAR